MKMIFFGLMTLLSVHFVLALCVSLYRIAAGKECLDWERPMFDEMKELEDDPI